MGLLNRFRESSAIRSVEASLQESRPLEDGVGAMQRLREIGTERAIPILREALFKDNAALQIQAARALAAIYHRHPDRQVLEALNGAVLHERQSPQAREAAIGALTEVVDVRHCGALLEVLKSHRTPTDVRTAAVRGLQKLRYPEILERLVESLNFGEQLDPRGEIRQWAVRELAHLDDRDKLTRMYEIIHGRHPLRCRPLNPDSGQAELIFVMVRVDPKGSVRFLHQMVDDDNPTVRSAATTALSQLRDRGFQA